MDRIYALLQHIEQDQQDPFLYYALALEYKVKDTEKAREWFAHLLENFPAYLPTYYHAAMLLAELGDAPQAEKVFAKGIALAKAQGELKTLAELQNALMNWEIEWGE